jgi:hypothetical protein
VWFLALLLSCGGPADPCASREDDADCDGVPDGRDVCPSSRRADLADAAGCTETQSAGCAVEALSPVDGAVTEGTTLFQWSGDCDVYLLQLADDARFPAAATRTASRTQGTEAAVTGTERYWRVVGGKAGASAGASTTPRELEWAR